MDKIKDFRTSAIYLIGIFLLVMATCEGANILRVGEQHISVSPVVVIILVLLMSITAILDIIDVFCKRKDGTEDKDRPKLSISIVIESIFILSLAGNILFA